MAYNVFNWYWIVAPLPSGEARIYSSKANDYVAADDAAFVAWQEVPDNIATRIDTEYNLGLVLGAYAPRVRPIPQAILDGYLDQQAADVIKSPDIKPLLDHENRLRSLEGAPAITADADIRAWITRTLKT